VSGLALGPCDAVFVSDTAGGRILFFDGACDAQAWIGGVQGPRGLAFAATALLAADTDASLVRHFALPALEAALSWSAWAKPTALTVDSKGRVLAIDAAAKRLHRVTADAAPDTAFDAAIAGSGRIAEPLFVAVGAEDRVIVSDAQSNAVVLFDAQGAFVRALAGPAGWLPGAIAVAGERAYVADAADGAILAFDALGAAEGTLPGYRGPVTALAAGAGGALYVKTGLDASYVVLAAGLAFVDHGRLEAGPFDAGEVRAWEWARLEASVPDGTRCSLHVAQRPAPAPAPGPGDWKLMACDDALLGPLLPGAQDTDRRYLWLRLSLETQRAGAAPSVAQARAATPGENYLEHLPFTFARNDQRADGQEGFLSRLLKLVRGEWRQVEERIDGMPRLVDPRFLDASGLPWLAQWLALELPQIAGDADRRELIARAHALLARRGTPRSIAEMVELHTGIRPAIAEAFDDRRIWVLGAASRLDFETRLPPLDPDGIVVAERDAQPACCPGPIGRAAVGESGPLTASQEGLPLFAENAYRFCVIVDAYRVRQDGTLAEIRRIVEREKPAHTDYRIELFDPDMRVGLQSRVGIDAIVGGDAPPWRVAATLGSTTRLASRDGASRVGESALGGPITLT
jgi:phage tail-like protein